LFAIVSQKEEETESLQTPTSMVILRSFPTVGDDTTLQQFLLGACTQGS